MLFSECVDYGDAPTFFASGVAAVNVIASGIVEIVLFRRVQLPSGESENRIVSRTIWSRDEWAQARLVAAQAGAAIQSGAQAAVAKVLTSH